jgi:hypothetical protein
LCDAADSCDAAGACQANPLPAGTLCRADAGECDVAESCDGSGTCPADQFEPEFTACGDSSEADCDAADSCSASGQCIDRVDPGTVLCRAAAGACDVPENCDGTSKICGPDGFEAPGAPCGDPSDTACTNPDSCSGTGLCRSNNEACAVLTDAALCPFDEGQNVCDSAAEDPYDDQFRLLYSPDLQSYSGYQIDAGVPPDAHYNALIQGAPGATLVVRFEVPYPYVTVGAQPLRIFDTADVSTEPGTGCFQPQGTPLPASDVQILLADYLVRCDTELGLCRNGVGSCTSDADCARPNGAGVTCAAPMGTACDATSGPDSGGSCSFSADVQLPASGEAYLSLHLEYGLQGIDVDLCGDGGPERYDWRPNASVGGLDAVESIPPHQGIPDAAIANCTDYTFRHRAGAAPALEATLENLNVFTLCSAPDDADCDGIADAIDQCPYLARNVQGADADGDGRGDECECGDQDGDGANTVSDLVAINEAIFAPNLVTPLCDANNDGSCDVSDIIAVNADLFSVGSTSTCARQPVEGP